MSDARDDRPDSAAAPDSAPRRPYLSVLFACCSVYVRIYRNADATGYHGRCPRCGKTVRFTVAPGGTPGRSFVVW
jgi:hypothetical protein